MENTTHSDDTPESKSQRKRDMARLREIAARLTTLSNSQLERVPYIHIREAVQTARAITKGNARKRQLQFIAKQLNLLDMKPVMAILDRLDASSASFIRQFHQLETWRDKLIAGDLNTMDEILALHPHADRQHIRQLTKNAMSELERGKSNAQFRKLFQYLKQVTDFKDYNPETEPEPEDD